MTETRISCPTCGTAIPVSEALAAQIRSELEATWRQDQERRLQAAVEQARAQASAGLELTIKDLTSQLAEQQRKTRQAQAAELALRKEKAALEERQRELDLEVARKVDAEKQRLEEQIRKVAVEGQALKLKEKDKQIEDLKALLEEARRKSEQGSQERQGEVLELDLETVLARSFPPDEIRPVPNGAIRGVIGSQLPEIPALELDAPPPPDESVLSHAPLPWLGGEGAGEGAS